MRLSTVCWGRALQGSSWLLLALFLPAAAAQDSGPQAGVLRAGARSIDVTPPPGLPLWGYGGRRDLPARAARDPLRAAVLVLEIAPEAGGRAVGDREGDAPARLALVGLDAGRALARKSMRALRQRLREEAGVAHLFLVASHTHHAPCLELEGVEPTASYVKELIEKIVSATADAARSTRPARLAAGSARIGLNRNRHSKLAPKPVDDRLVVLHVVGVDDRPIATAVNFAAHPTTVPATLLEYSADFPGPLREKVEEDLGGTCVFLQGAAGDLSANRRGKSTEEYGRALADEAVRLVRGLEPGVPEAPSLAVRGEEFRFERMRIDLRDPLTYLKYCAAFFKALVDAYVEEYAGGVRPRLDVVLLDGDIGIVGVSGEFFSSHAIRLRERARLRELFFLGYANGYHQYFPTIEAVAEGGYGADPDVSPVEIGAGERMMDRALFHLYDLRDSLE